MHERHSATASEAKSSSGCQTRSTAIEHRGITSNMDHHPISPRMLSTASNNFSMSGSLVDDGWMMVKMGPTKV